MAPPRQLTLTEIGCWLVKTRRPPHLIAPDWTAGTTRTLARCLRKSYRVDLMAPGQPCVLWLSGPEQPGVHAIGRLTSGARDPASAEPHDRTVEVSTSLLLLPEPVPRSALRADPAFATAEVLRMPAGSNPSYLPPAGLAILREFLEPEVRQATGW